MAARCNQRLRLESRAREGDGDGSAVQRGVMHGVDDHALANAFWRERERAMQSTGGATLMRRRERQREADSRQ